MENLLSIMFGLLIVVGAIKFLKGVIKTIVILVITLIVVTGLLAGWDNVLLWLGILA